MDLVSRVFQGRRDTSIGRRHLTSVGWRRNPEDSLQNKISDQAPQEIRRKILPAKTAPQQRCAKRCRSDLGQPCRLPSLQEFKSTGNSRREPRDGEHPLWSWKQQEPEHAIGALTPIQANIGVIGPPPIVLVWDLMLKHIIGFIIL